MSYIKLIGDTIQVFGEVKPDEDAIYENIINYAQLTSKIVKDGSNNKIIVPAFRVILNDTTYHFLPKRLQAHVSAANHYSKIKIMEN